MVRTGKNATRKVEQTAEQRGSLLEAEEMARFWRSRIGASPNEVFEVAYLDSAYCLYHSCIPSTRKHLASPSEDRGVFYNYHCQVNTGDAAPVSLRCKKRSPVSLYCKTAPL